MSDLNAFRNETRDWLEANCPESMRTPMSQGDVVWGGRKVEFKEPDQKLWMDRMGEKGWTCPTWPKEYGGINATPIERIIGVRRNQNMTCQEVFLQIGLGMCGPVMMQYASEEQKERYLPPMAEGKEIWCQLFSEPSAGSDVAGLRSKAVKDGDEWIINGQKVWTSGAHYSDFGILVVRHDPDLEKHKGLTFFLLI